MFLEDVSCTLRRQLVRPLLLRRRDKELQASWGAKIYIYTPFIIHYIHILIYIKTPKVSSLTKLFTTPHLSIPTGKDRPEISAYDILLDGVSRLGTKVS